MKKIFHQITVLLFTFILVSHLIIQPAPVRAGSPILEGACWATDLIPNLLARWGMDFLQQALDGPWYDPSLCSFREKVYDPDEDQLFGERYTFAQVNWITNSLILQAWGRADLLTTPANVIRSLFSENREPVFSDFVAFGPPGILIGSISEMVNNPPASGVDSIRSTLAKFDPVSTVHAQQTGYGFNNTSFLRPIWSASRNMAYAIMIILLIASGFLVMFRIKINPQTAVSLQLMIPRIIITLLLVTFSYAIAGLMIDLLFLLLSIVLGLLQSNGLVEAGSRELSESVRFFLTPGFGKIFVYYTNAWNTIGWGVMIPLLGPLFGFVLSLVMMFLLIKVWWMMLKTYLTLMFLIITGPLQIMLGILPGQSGFSSWLRNFIANLSVFGVVPLMFIINMIFWNNNGIFNDIMQFLFGQGGEIRDFYQIQPQIIAPSSQGALPDLPLFGSQGFIFNFALGYAILALMPKTAEMIRDALKVPAFKYGTAFGESLASPLRNTGGFISNPIVASGVGAAVDVGTGGSIPQAQVMRFMKAAGSVSKSVGNTIQEKFRT